MLLTLQGSAARALPGSSLFPLSSTLQTPASGAADSYTFGGNEELHYPNAIRTNKLAFASQIRVVTIKIVIYYLWT